jgi:hypothetical protein
MKTKTLIPLIVAGLSFLPIVLGAQDTPASEILQKLQERRAGSAGGGEVEGQQSYDAQVQHNQGQSAKQQAEATGEYKRANSMFQDRLRGVINRGPASPGGPLVIWSTELADPKEQANLDEDLVVMSHLLEKTVSSALGSQPHASSVLGVNVVFAPGQNLMRGLYLEGYGALFTLSVGFPLLPSPKREAKENPSADSTWNEARQEVFGQRWEGQGGYARGEEFDERKVNTLQDSVLVALRNATHIRGLKADDSIMVCVFGGSVLRMKVITADNPGAPKPKDVYAPDSLQPRTTVLTIRVKKSDADSFANDKLNLDEFRKRAKIMTYAGGPETATGSGFVGGGGGSFGRQSDGGSGNTFGGRGGY